MESRRKGKEEEEEKEEPRREIRFLEGINFLGAIDRKHRKRKRKRRTTAEDKAQERKKDKGGMTMHEHVMCKNKLHHGQKLNATYNTYIF